MRMLQVSWTSGEKWKSEKSRTVVTNITSINSCEAIPRPVEEGGTEVDKNIFCILRRCTWSRGKRGSGVLSMVYLGRRQAILTFECLVMVIASASSLS